MDGAFWRLSGFKLAQAFIPSTEYSPLNFQGARESRMAEESEPPTLWFRTWVHAANFVDTQSLSGAFNLVILAT
jgi:hypothetical protein